ncbi:MAG: TerB family tellurite resistance protein [Minwuia sp.]|uniref:tellurite resistance TerB family protein n=1 Tax=Minwuia sp. TaxID=2493630 RepID=UPI003A8A4700
MLNRVARWLSGEESSAAGQVGGFDELQICAAALLVEAAHLDGEFTDDERGAIAGALRRQFELSDDETESLIGEAERVHSDAVEISRFTRAVKALPHERRIEILEAMWDVVLADGDLHAYEANLLRRVGGLIYVSDRENGEARQRAAARQG